MKDLYLKLEKWYHKLTADREGIIEEITKID